MDRNDYREKICLFQIANYNFVIEFKREKFYPGPGLEPGPLAFRANALTAWAIQDKYRTTAELISQAIFSVEVSELV